MSDNLQAFTIDLEHIAQKMPEDVVLRAHRALTLEALKRVVLRTPVDRGQARGNWQVTSDAPAGGVLNRPDPSGAQALQEGQNAVARLLPFTVSFLTNNLDYILTLENGGFVPKDPENSAEANRRRRSSRSPKRREHARLVTGDEGGPLVRGGYSIQAANGMVGITFEELNQVQVDDGNE